MWLRGVRPQGSKTISSFCCGVLCPGLMRPLAHTRRWSERPLLFVPDPQGPARQSQYINICRRLRRKTDVGEGCALAAKEAGAVGRVRCKSRRRSFSIITANVTSWGSGRHYLGLELPSLAVIQEHHLAHDNITETRWLGLAISQSFLQLSPTRLAMALLVVWLS